MRLLRGLLLAASIVAAQTLPYDLVIEGGRIYDGSGNPWYTGDIAIRADRIVAIGFVPPAPTRLRLSGKGLSVAPGFVDAHSHARAGIIERPGAENYLRQGVTTIIEGQDGNSPLPLGPFLLRIARLPMAINFASMAGHGTIRAETMGSADRKASPAELLKMKALARQAMLDGALGLSTGLFYVPGNFAPTEEVIELAKVVGAMGGVHVSHIRDETGNSLASVRETIRIGEEGGLPTQVTHHKIIGKANWGKSIETLRLVEEARARGVDVTIDMYPYTASSTTIGAALFPQWAQEGGRKALLERLAAPEQRARIKTEVAKLIRNERGGGDPKNVQLARCDFDPKLAGRTLAEVTAARGLAVTIENAAEVTLEIERQGGCMGIFHAIGEEDIERILRSPYTMIGSDGGIPEMGRESPHPRAYGTFARVLGLYARDRKVISIEEAIRKMSSMPASRYRLADRGLLRVGMKADVAVFDLAKVRDRADYAKPHQYSEGFVHVVVNGRIVLRDGKVTGEKPGKVLYGPGRR